MNSLQLYLNDERVDLDSDSPIGLTFQINNLANVQNQNGNTSNQFKLPLTQVNRAILGFPDDIRFTTQIPYTQLKARIIQDGLEVVPDGFAEINSVDDDSASITVLSGNVDFFDSIDGSIYDMGDITTITGAKQVFAPYQHAWTLDNVVNSRTKTSGWIWPVIDYGSLLADAPVTVDIRQQRPGFFIKTAIELIASQINYKIKGTILSDPLYSQLICQYANSTFEHGTDYQNAPSQNGIIVHSVVNQSYNYGRNGADENIRLGAIDSDPSHRFDIVGSSYNANQNIKLDFTFEYDLQYYSTSNTGSVDIIIRLFDPPTNQYVDLASITHVSDQQNGGAYKYSQLYPKNKISVTETLAIGQGVQVWYSVPQSEKKKVGFTMLAGAKFTVSEETNEVLLGQTVQCERIFPDISQKDLIKDTLQRFGIICQTDNTRRELTFATFQDIVRNIPIAKNWTDKAVNQGKSVNFQLGSYSHANNMKYKADDAIPTGYADDVINVDDQTLPTTGDLFESQFAPSLNTPFLGGSVAQIKQIEDYTDSLGFTVGTQPRILVDQKLNLFSLGGNKTVTFTDGTNSKIVNDVISTPYFYKGNGAFNLCWKDQPSQPGLRSLYYKELEKILYRCKRITRNFLLTPRDIQELDLLIPIYLEQDNAYFYINSIQAWRKGVVTKVELVKLGEI